MEALWNDFAQLDNFLLAWHRIVNNTSRMIRDDLGMMSFSHNLIENLNYLLELVQSDVEPKYEPLSDHKVYVPKPSTTLRTMSLLSIPDLVVYQAMVNTIAEKSHGHLVSHEHEHVLGNIYAGTTSKYMLKHWKWQYKRFNQHIEKLVSRGNVWIASTDIVAFYDTIDHERLKNLVQKYCGYDDRFLQLFGDCLTKWAAHTNGEMMSRGIPQGSNASDYLATLFLHDIDRHMIAKGFNYLRYVDDVRILEASKARVTRGLIEFDLELKKAGLVAQVNKTSIHEIVNIEDETSSLRFSISDPRGIGDFWSVPMPSLKADGQAQYLVDSEQANATEFVSTEINNSETEYDDEGQPILVIEEKIALYQEELRKFFLENYNAYISDKSNKAADTAMTFCLYRLTPHNDIIKSVLSLLELCPWRSEVVTTCLSKFRGNPIVISGLDAFLSQHTIYSWHLANVLHAYHKVSGAKSIAHICRNWLSSSSDWFRKMVAAKILTEVPGQHSFLLECLREEQFRSYDNPEETAILRQYLAYGAYKRCKSHPKQVAVMRLIFGDKSNLLHRLALYVLQDQNCSVKVDEFNPQPDALGSIASLIKTLGLSQDIKPTCAVVRILRQLEVKVHVTELRDFYGDSYQTAVTAIKKTQIAYNNHMADNYVHYLHSFAHLTLIGFYQTVLGINKGVKERKYAALLDDTNFTKHIDASIWKQLAELRLRVDHPVDHTTKDFSKPISFTELEKIHRRMIVALNELFTVWDTEFR